MYSSTLHLISSVRLTPSTQLRRRLHIWRSRGRETMDFRLKKLKRGYGGLNFGLCPGPYQGDPMPDNAIHIADDTFWFLAAAIKQHLSGRPMDYCGVTKITRREWLSILDEWQGLQYLLQRARIPLDLPVLRQVPKHARRMFVRDFVRNCAGMAKMIGLLEKWLRAELESNDELFIAGL